MTRLYGLFGFPLSHSFSKKYFTEKFAKEGIIDCAYENFESRNAVEIRAIIADNKNLRGLNVTIPHKQQVVQAMDWLDDVARSIQAVNCIKIIRSENGYKLHGYNTDAYGFEKAITPFLKPHHTQALILGTGGSSKAVAYILNKLNIQFSFVWRNDLPKGYSYDALNEQIIADHSLIINTTPLGMYPDVDAFPPIPYEHLSSQHLLFDLIYNPEETLFLRKGKAQGATTVNGMNMLIQQAEKSWEIWNDDHGQ
jgi:shikimate dehydrogenase